MKKIFTILSLIILSATAFSAVPVSARENVSKIQTKAEHRTSLGSLIQASTDMDVEISDTSDTGSEEASSTPIRGEKRNNGMEVKTRAHASIQTENHGQNVSLFVHFLKETRDSVRSELHAMGKMTSDIFNSILSSFRAETETGISTNVDNDETN